MIHWLQGTAHSQGNRRSHMPGCCQASIILLSPGADGPAALVINMLRHIDAGLLTNSMKHLNQYYAVMDLSET